MLKKKYQFPKHVKLENGLLSLEGHLYLPNRQIYLKDITSIRVYVIDTKSSYSFIPTHRTMEQDITIRQKKDEDVVIYMKSITTPFWIDPVKGESKGSKKFSDTSEFILFIENQTLDNRLNQYLENQTDEVLINYNPGKSGAFSQFDINNFIFYKDGTIKSEGKYFASIDLDKYNIVRDYKSLSFEDKNISGIKKLVSGPKVIDIGWDFDIVLSILSNHFGITIP